MDNYQEAYFILLDGVITAITELDRKRWGFARDKLADAKKDAENCFTRDEPATDNEALLIPIQELDLPVHEYHVLRYARLRNLAEVIELGPKKLRKLRNCGKQSYQIILEKLADSGFELTDDWWYWLNRKP